MDTSNTSNLRMRRLSVFLATLIMIICSIGFGASNGRGFRVQSAPSAFPVRLGLVVTNLSSPVYVTNAHDGSNRLFIVEQGGLIKVLQPGTDTPTVFLDITSRVLSGGERGLLGLAFHPQYSTNRRFFVYYTRQTDGSIVIAEYHTSLSDPNLADSAETVLLTIAHPNFANHNGGMIEFGPDGYLYIGTGDGGSGNDPPNNAQNINVLLGKILRIDVDHPNGSVPYSSPASNPFFGATAGADEIYAYGMRNPFRFSFDRGTGQLYAGDVGQDAWEEIDIISLGGNYGWRVYEGNHCTNNDPALCGTAGFTFPIAEYGHTLGRCAIIGGYVYRGAMSTLPLGAYVYGDLCTGEIFLLLGGAQTVLRDTINTISSFGEDEAGELYLVELGSTVYRITTQPGIDTIGLYDPAHAAFFLRYSDTGGVANNSFTYGPAGTGLIPLEGDWDGDGIRTPGLYDQMHGTFFLKNSNSGGAADMTFSYGPAGLGWIPLVGDWDGDGTETVGLYDPAHGAFFLKNSNSGGFADISFTFGPAGSSLVPIVGDWDGDGTVTIGLYDPAHARFLLRNSNTAGVADVSFTFGAMLSGLVPLVGDWNGDGTDTIGLYDPAHGAFFLRNSNTGGIADISFTYGPAAAGLRPLAGDWNGR